MIFHTKLTVRYLFKVGFSNVFDQVMLIDKYACFPRGAKHVCSAGKCRIAWKRHNLRKMSHRRREMSQSAENVVNTTTGICRIVDGKCRKKSLPVYVATSTGNVAIIINIAF